MSAAGRLSEAAFATAPWGLRALADLPPLPLPEPSAAYTANLMADPEVAPSQQTPISREQVAVSGGSGCPHIGLTAGQGLVGPMRLWDASMGYAIAKARREAPHHGRESQRRSDAQMAWNMLSTSCLRVTATWRW